MRKDRVCKIYVSNAAALRLMCIKDDAKYLGMNLNDVARVLAMSRSTLGNIVQGRSIPSLTRYLRFANLLEWDLSEDVNYAYATQKYPTLEIKHRIRRLGYRSFEAFAHTVGYYNAHHLMYSLSYEERKGSSIAYATGMLYISHEEHRLGYSDALDLED